MGIDSAAHETYQAAGAFARFPTRLRNLALLALLMFAPGAWSQAAAPTSMPAPPPAQSGIIRGVAGGASGEVYEGVNVELAGPGNSPPQTQTTGPAGTFQFTNVPPGPFRLRLSSRGFVTQTISGVMHPAESFDAHTIVLPVAETSSSVRVTASQTDIAQAQLNVEEKQRVLGVIPNYFVTYDPHAAPLTNRQKYQLAWKSSVDPVTFAAAGLFAGIEQADDTFHAYGQGTQGYAKRYGATYADTFVATMLGGAVFPALFRQDPRYFVKGAGSVRSRIWYATYNALMCKGDNGKWQVNYSGILGELAAGGISNLYYPSEDRNGAAVSFEGAGIGIGASVLANFAQEFLIRKITPHAGESNGQ